MITRGNDQSQLRRRRGSGARLASEKPSFVGRESEIAFLTDRLTAAGGGEGGTVLISGEPGIGKTRLLAEFASYARDEGWLVLSGSAYETEGMPPYLPFAEPIAQHIRAAPNDEAVQRLADTAREIALLVPGLRERISSASPPEYVSADRYRLFEAVTDYLLGLAAGTEAAGLLLCLDDLHWADKSTLFLFQHLSRKLDGARLLVVGTYRPEEIDDSHPLSSVIAELAREGKAQRLALGRLSREETAALVASFDYAPGPALSDAIYRQTDGNPFFVQEIVRHLKSGAESQSSALPESIRQVVGHRLSRLDASTRAHLENAAVLGDGFEVALLRAMAGSEAASTTAALEISAQAGLLREASDGYVFAHPLIRQVIYEAISLARRHELHLQAAKATETAHSSALDAHLSAIATHYRLSASEPAKVIEYATRAGDRAAAVYAFDEALGLFELALNTLRATGGVGAGLEAARLLVKVGEAQSGLGRWEEAKTTLKAALPNLTSEERANLLLMLSNTSLRGEPDLDDSHRFGIAALEIARELSRSDLEAAANALIAQCEEVQGEIRSSIARYERAYAKRDEITPVLRHRVFGNFALGLHYAGRLEDAIAVSDETVRSAVASRDTVASVLTHTNLGLTLAAVGRYDEALMAFEAARESASAYRAAGILQVLSRSIGMSASVPMAVFAFDRAERIANETRELGNSLKFLLPVISEGIDLMVIATHRGDFGLADALAIEVQESMALGGAHEVLWGIRLAEARAELALARAEWPAALSLGEEALQRARSMGRPKYQALALATRGSALAALGRKKEALGELRQAVETARDLGDPSVYLRVASSQVAIEAEGDLVADARSTLEAMFANLSDEEMRRCLAASRPAQIVSAFASSTGAEASKRRPIYPDGLTEREVEVLRLVAGGSSNREIAAALVVSVRTVERHVTNIYGKIGARGKADATSYAIKQSLV